MRRRPMKTAALAAAAPLVALVLTACSGTNARIDRDGGDDPIADLRQPGGGKDAATTLECELPYYAALIVSNSGSGTARGRVERLPLDGRGRCKPLSLGNSLPYDANAVAFLPPDTIAVGALSGIYQIGFDDKAAAPVYKPATFAWTSLVDDLFPLVGQDGKTLLAIAYDASNLGGSNTIEFLVTIDGDQEVSRWTVGSSETIRVGFDPYGMAPSVNDPHKFFVLKGLSDPYAAGEFVAPWDDQPVEVEDNPYYQLNLGAPGSALTIKTLRQQQGGAILKRTVWTFRPSTGSGYQVYMVNQVDDGKKQLLGPYICTNPVCSSAQFDAYTDAGPDFTDDTAVVAVCSDADNPDSVNHVVRIRDSGDCEVILDGNELLAQEYPLRLAPVYLEP